MPSSMYFPWLSQTTYYPITSMFWGSYSPTRSYAHHMRWPNTQACFAAELSPLGQTPHHINLILSVLLCMLLFARQQIALHNGYKRKAMQMICIPSACTHFRKQFSTETRSVTETTGNPPEVGTATDSWRLPGRGHPCALTSRFTFAMAILAFGVRGEGQCMTSGSWRGRSLPSQWARCRCAD